MFLALVFIASAALAAPSPKSFQWEIPQKHIVDFNRRLDEAIFPRFKSFSDRNATMGGVNIGYMRDLVKKWRKHDIDRLVQVVSRDSYTVDVDSETTIHFKHIRDESAIAARKPALLLLHGWPGSFLEFESAAKVLRKDYELVSTIEFNS